MSSENTKYLLDTWAWIEYFLGSSAGKTVNELLNSGNIFTSIISIAELSDKYYSEGLIEEWSDRYTFIVHKSQILDVSLSIAKVAGLRKWELRKQSEDIGLADSIIIEPSLQNNLRVVSGDGHFKNIENALYLGN